MFKNNNGMKKHFNRVKRQYRYKSKEFKETIFSPHKRDEINGKCKDGTICVFVKHNYKPYFLFRLFWFIKRNIMIIIPTENETKKKVISDLIILIIGTIISYAILKFCLVWI